jgi:hypothetical protein
MATVNGRRALGSVAIAIFLSVSACKSDGRGEPASNPSGSGGATATADSGAGGATDGGGGTGGAGGASPIGGPIHQDSPTFRAGLQVNGSITYLRNK